MSIAWLLFYANPVNPELVSSNNEQSAFATHARWRAFLKRTGRLFNGFRTSARERIAHRALLPLSDHLLKDIGMYRSGTVIRIEEVRHFRSLKTATPISSEISCSRCVVLPDMQTTSDTATVLSSDTSTKAA